MSYQQVKGKNTLEIKHATDPGFRKFGRIVDELDFSELIETLEKTTEIGDKGEYKAGHSPLEALPIKDELERLVYGGMPVEIGFCNGKNSMLNALEYHKGDEVIVPADDIVLLIACLSDVEDGQLDTKYIEAYYVERGQAVELYGTTMHLSPCKTSEKGYRTVIILPQGTNLPLSRPREKSGEAARLIAINKWMFFFKDEKMIAETGTDGNIIGKNFGVDI